ncbi:MAG: carbohydrate ABC transporter permease, partial [Candidatus Fimadaptatus sp.]
MQTYYKKTLGTKLFDIFNVIMLVLFSLTIIFPFWNQLCISFSDISTYPVSNVSLAPLGFNTEAYEKLMSDTRILKCSWISVMRVVVGTVSTLFCTGLLAYVSSITWFSGHKLLRRAFVLTMYFSAGLIPTYLTFIS